MASEIGMHVVHAIGDESGGVTRGDTTRVSSHMRYHTTQHVGQLCISHILQEISLPAQSHTILTVNMHILGSRAIYFSALFRCHTDQLHQTRLCCTQYHVALKKRSDDSRAPVWLYLYWVLFLRDLGHSFSYQQVSKQAEEHSCLHFS